MSRTGLLAPIALALLALFASACTAFPDIPTGECGNGVIDAPQEDCDSFPLDGRYACRPKGAVGECHLDCSPENDVATACPPGWGCDSSALCREPTGDFEATSRALDVGAWLLSAGDFDGDGRDDVMSSDPPDSIGEARVRFFYFDAQGQFAESRQFPKLIISPKIADLSDDDADTPRSDVAFSDGRIGAMQGQADRSWVPDTFSSYQVKNGRVREVNVSDQSIDGGTGIASIIDIGSGANFLVPSDQSSMMLLERGSLGGRLTDLAGDPVSGDLIEDAKHAPGREVVYALKGADHFRLVTTSDTNPDTGMSTWRDRFEQQDIALDPPLPIDGAPLIVDLNGDQHLDVLVGAAGEAYASFGDGVTLAPAVPYFVTGVDSDSKQVSVRLAMPLAAGDYTGDGAADFVFPEYLIGSTTRYSGTTPVYEVVYANRLGAPYTSAVIGDFNGNGKVDVVAASSGALNLAFFNGQGSEDLVASTVTSGPVQSLLSGDFDGDLVDDLAVLEVPAAGQTTNTLKIAFGSPSQPLVTPQTIAHLNQPEALSVFHENGIDGILVCSNELLDDGPTGALSFLGGSGDRVPFAPYSLTEFASNDSLRDFAAMSISVGHFTGQKAADLIALAFPMPNLQVEKPPLEPWFFPSLEKPGSTPVRSPHALDSRLRPINYLTTRPDFEADIASTALDGNADGRDEAAFAMPAGDDRAQCGVLSMAVDAPPAVIQHEPVILDEPCHDPQLGAADIDGDGFPDLVLLTGASGALDRKLYVLWNDGSGNFSSEQRSLLSDADESPQAFTILPGSKLWPLGVAYVVPSALRLVRATSRGRALPPAATLYDQLTSGTGVVAADVNGDRVSDLVVSEAGSLRVFEAQLRAE